MACKQSCQKQCLTIIRIGKNKGDEHLTNHADDQLQETVDESTEIDQTTNQESPEEILDQNDQVSQLEEEVTNLQDQVYRLSAEISNIQKRNAKERQDAAKYRSQSLAQNLLPAIDNIERALDTELDQEQALSLKKGIEMVYESLLYALKQEGIVEIEALNQPFDPTRHHAVQTVPVQEGQEPDQVVQVFQKGYLLNDRVLRPAMVIVSQ